MTVEVVSNWILTSCQTPVHVASAGTTEKRVRERRSRKDDREENLRERGGHVRTTRKRILQRDSHERTTVRRI